MSVLEAIDLLYPEDDGKPLSENTIQFRLITTIVGGLKAMYRDRADVFVAGDLAWFPLEGATNITQAPDAMVVFGRPKGDRRSYRQWLEADIPPQVTFEIASPSNDPRELERTKRGFYERYGVEEYYLFYPERAILKGWQRRGRRLVEIPNLSGWISPRLGLRFEVESGDLSLYRPDGEQLRDYPEVVAQLESERQRAELESQRAELERQRAELERQQSEQYRQQLELESQRAERERQQSEQYRQQLELESERAERESERAERERQQSEQYRQQLELESQRAERESERAERERQQSEQYRQRAELESQRAERLRETAIARLLSFGLTVEQVAESLALSLDEVSEVAARLNDGN